MYSTEEFNETYSNHSLQHASNLEQGQYPTQNFPPAAVNLLDWNDSFLRSFIQSNSISQASATLPIQTSTPATLPLCSYLDIIVGNNSGTLSVAAPVPVPHATRTKAALRTMMSFDDQGSVSSYSSMLNWHDRYLPDKGDDTRSTVGDEPLEITDTRSRVDLDNRVLHPNVQAAMEYSTVMNSGNDKHTAATGRSKLVIRPISPSTLMALTEPCLMAWCTAFDESLTEPGSSACFPSQNCVVDKNNHFWGY